MRPVRKEIVPDDITGEIFLVSKIVEDEYEKIKPEITIDHRTTECIEELLKETTKLKHLKQIGSIIGEF